MTDPQTTCTRYENRYEYEVSGADPVNEYPPRQHTWGGRYRLTVDPEKLDIHWILDGRGWRWSARVTGDRLRTNGSRGKKYQTRVWDTLDERDGPITDMPGWVLARLVETAPEGAAHPLVAEVSGANGR